MISFSSPSQSKLLHYIHQIPNFEQFRADILILISFAGIDLREHKLFYLDIFSNFTELSLFKLSNPDNT